VNKIYIIFILLLSSCISKQKKNNLDYLGQQTPKETPEVFEKGIVSVKNRFEMGFTISPDGKSMAFGVLHESLEEETCIYIMNFVDGKWTAPHKMGIPDNNNTFFPMFAPNGTEFYYTKQSKSFDTNIWSATYVNNKVINPKLLDTIINSSFREAGHGKSEIGNLYFTSNRDLAQKCCGDIYRTSLNNTVEKVETLSSNFDEESLFLAPDESYIIIQAWKNKFKTKHDLYISYKTKNGLWTTPERLNSKINTKSIEQRPFVSPDKDYLFFSRTSVTQIDGEENYESDIFWVSTKKIFKPYVYNTSFNRNVVYNKSFKINLPKDLFKHINNSDLRYKISLQNNVDIPNWIEFDTDLMLLKGIWKPEQQINIEITAIDEFGNKGVFNFELGSN